MQSMLGAVTIDVDPQSWPLSGLVPTSFARNRVFLAGESAHVFPPIGAQGLNLGVRDVETLLETLPNDGIRPRCVERHDPPITASAARTSLRGQAPSMR